MADALVDALARRIEPSSGTIHLGDNAIHELHIDELRTHVLAAPHDAALFIGTVGDNIDAVAPIGSRNDEAIAAAAADQVISHCRSASQPESPSKGILCPAVSVSASRWRGHWRAKLPSWSCTIPPLPSLRHRSAHCSRDRRGTRGTRHNTSDQQPVLLDICDRVIEL